MIDIRKSARRRQQKDRNPKRVRLGGLVIALTALCLGACALILLWGFTLLR